MTAETMERLQAAQSRRRHADTEADLARPETLDALVAASEDETAALRQLAAQAREHRARQTLSAQR